jgi:hypothetical protein
MAFSFIGVCSAQVQLESTKIFGTVLSFEATDATDQKKLRAFIESIKSSSQAFDPDCYYGSPGKECPKINPTPLSSSAEKLSEEFKTQTGGDFNILRTVGDSKKRDFGGMIQGFVIDEMKKNSSTPFIVNFAGDIYISPDFKNRPPLAIEDAIVTGAKLATVSMSSGWMLGSTSAALGSKIIDPKSQEPVKSEFLKVVLFAKPNFSGARLDAWSTALIVGGKVLLDKLSSLEEFKGQWGYVIIANNENAYCSANLSCDFKQGIGQNYVQVPW